MAALHWRLAGLAAEKMAEVMAAAALHWRCWLTAALNEAWAWATTATYGDDRGDGEEGSNESRQAVKEHAERAPRGGGEGQCLQGAIWWQWLCMAVGFLDPLG